MSQIRQNMYEHEATTPNKSKYDASNNKKYSYARESKKLIKHEAE